MTQPVKIDWQYPEPRKGLAGSYDKFVGPGITTAENLLGLFAALAAAVAMLCYALFANLGWSVWQIAIAVFVAFDIAGGIFTNASSSAKRWYHRATQTTKHHLIFVAVHLHPLIIAWQYRSMDWLYFVVVYAYLLMAATTILLIPLYLRRPVAMALFFIGVLIGLYAFSPTPGWEWFIPGLYLKLLICHLLHEEPYRPDSESL
jgi:hypothetical protein